MLVTLCKVQRLQQFNGSTISYAQEVTVLTSYLTGINFREEIHTLFSSPYCCRQWLWFVLSLNKII